MSYEAFPHLHPTAEQHLGGMPYPLAREVGTKALSLSHLNLYKNAEPSATGAFHDLGPQIPSRRLGQEHQPHLDQLTTLQVATARFAGEAYAQLTQDAPGEVTYSQLMARSRKLAISES